MEVVNSPPPLAQGSFLAAMTDLLPLFPLGTVVFPGMPLPLHVFEERYRRLLADRGEATPAFGVVLLKSGNELSVEQRVYEVGTATRIVSRRTRRGGRSDIVVEGLQRFEILSINWEMGYGLATIQWREELIGDRERLGQAMTPAIVQFQRYVRGVTQVTGRHFQGVRMNEDPIAASYDLASRLPLHTWERQDLLTLDRADERFELLRKIVRREVALLTKSGAVGLAINHPGQTFTLN